MSAVHPSDAKYVCQLDKASEKKAKEELQEDPKERLSAVQSLRTWVEQQPHISFPTDTITLLGYLRTAKFSQLQARERIENYTRLVTQFPKFHRDLDTHSSGFHNVLDTGYLVVLPKKDKNGCEIQLCRIAVPPVSPDRKYSVYDEMKAVMAIALHTIRDEGTQVNGIIYIMDCTHLTVKGLTRYTSKDVTVWETQLLKALAGRYKGIHYYNAGAVFEALMALYRPFLPKKFKDRIHVHDTMESLYKHIDMELLPDEYLPDDYKGASAGSIADIVERYKHEVMKPEIRQQLLQDTSEAACNYDETKRPNYTQAKESFRKLNVD